MLRALEMVTCLWRWGESNLPLDKSLVGLPSAVGPAPPKLLFTKLSEIVVDLGPGS